MRNKIVTHFCGGFAINASVNIFGKLVELGNGFAEYKFNYIDTSDRNIALVKEKLGPFWLVKKDTNAGAEISGSGAERRANSAAIKSNIALYLDEIKCTKMKSDEFHLIVCSASGGSGSVIAPYILIDLLEKNIPVTMMMVGDSKDGMSANNTLNTLASLDNIAKKYKKSIAIMYVNNSNMLSVEYKNKEKEADAILKSYAATLALFLSGNNLDLDNQDMRSILDQSNYKSFNVSPGLYGLQFYKQTIKEIPDSAPTVIRTLTTGDKDFILSTPVLHHKVGYITEPDALEAYDGQLPIHMVVYNNFFINEEKSLKSITSDANNIISNIQSKDIKGSDNSITNDDDIIL